MADSIKNMTPKQIVAELDKYIIGQDEAKKYVAIALRNRYRRSLLSEEMREEVSPKNILMMGPTGVGKTEIARRLAKLMDAPFVKVEATKFTEVGYVGRDVDSMIRDLVEASMRLSKQKRIEENSEIANVIAEDIIVKAIIPSPESEKSSGVQLGNIFGNLGYKTQRQEYEENRQKELEASREYSEIKMARDQVREQLRAGLLEDQIIEIEVDDVPKTNQLDNQNEGMIAIGNIFEGMMPKKTKRKKCKVSDARRILRDQEAQKLMDDPAFNRRFTRLIVDELTKEQTLEILKKIKLVMYAHYDSMIAVNDKLLPDVVTIADEYRTVSSHRPDNAITLPYTVEYTGTGANDLLLAASTFSSLDSSGTVTVSFAWVSGNGGGLAFGAESEWPDLDWDKNKVLFSGTALAALKSSGLTVYLASGDVYTITVAYTD